MNKRGASILTENIIFIVLNIVYLSILVLFLFQQASGVTLLEESYSKQIALLIDSSKPGMEIYIDMTEGIEAAEEEKYSGNFVIINDNLVTVKLSEKSSYTYSFF